MIIKPAKRTESVQEYYFSRKNREMDALNAARAEKGLPKIINLGIGSPNDVHPKEAIDALIENAPKPDVHGYQSYMGIPALREAFAKWYERYYNVKLDPKTEIQPLTGSKEGILIATLAFVDKGEKILVPDPGYPTYASSALMAEAELVRYDLKAEDGWYPDFDALEKMDLTGVKLMWTNYPNMPTGAKASRELYKKIVDFGRRHKILIINDNPYSFILNEDPISIFSIEGARECCLEMNSLSKAHNMAGWRVGMIAGDAEAISLILKVKSQMDSGMFKPLQLAAIKALSQGPEWFEKLNEEYRRRRAAASRIMDTIGAKYNPDSAGLFVFGKVEADNPNLTAGSQKTRGEQLSDKFLYEAGVFITPGYIFGHNGENYVRVSLCANPEVLDEANERIKKVL